MREAERKAIKGKLQEVVARRKCLQMAGTDWNEAMPVEAALLRLTNTGTVVQGCIAAAHRWA